ncbi:F510_1955 family glycosylhydrolase [Paenisporosarcina sp. OV554]|uniref:F510_1955 family glycosylhydrolase n=1 Tax=Paenisporosarcina sp. OV554 TaxID=2135694 RepID=UPI000D46D8E6|nr:sialidase [Paenisporosarcina sp. OV554]PUB13370.1 sortilin (neurotensin receptor 3) [Paenisporosarcina sp. OV554]
MKTWIIIMGLLSLTLAACSSNDTTEDKEKTVDEATQDAPVAPSDDFYQETTDTKVDHIHGLGYPGSGDALMLASHHGPLLYEEGTWKETTGEKHDYMGFQAVDDGFVSSGHPEPGSDYENPLGLLKSTDAGETFKQYAFAGEIDFHYLAASYHTNRIYVFNEMPTDKLENGFFYTDDYGQKWTTMDLNGFEAEMISNMAAHPDTPETVAIGTDRGLYLSTDAGQSFSLFKDDMYITYVTLSKSHAYVAELVGDKVQLVQIDLTSKEAKTLSGPQLAKENAVTYIATHPTNDKEISIATLQNNVYQTTDGGVTWKSLVKLGDLTKE